MSAIAHRSRHPTGTSREDRPRPPAPPRTSRLDRSWWRHAHQRSSRHGWHRHRRLARVSRRSRPAHERRRRKRPPEPPSDPARTSATSPPSTSPPPPTPTGTPSTCSCGACSTSRPTTPAPGWSAAPTTPPATTSACSACSACSSPASDQRTATRYAHQPTHVLGRVSVTPPLVDVLAQGPEGSPRSGDRHVLSTIGRERGDTAINLRRFPRMDSAEVRGNCWLRLTVPVGPSSDGAPCTRERHQPCVSGARRWGRGRTRLGGRGAKATATTAPGQQAYRPAVTTLAPRAEAARSARHLVHDGWSPQVWSAWPMTRGC